MWGMCMSLIFIFMNLTIKARDISQAELKSCKNIICEILLSNSA